MSIPRLTEINEGFQEGLTGYCGVIDSDHAYIHDGIAFTAVIDTGSISAAYRIAFKTPTVASGRFIHWRPIGIQSSADYAKYVLTEDETYSGGSSITPINRDRLSPNTSTMQAVAKGVTSTPSGTTIQIGGIGSSGTPRSQAGGGSAAAQELVLKQDTVYVLTLTPDGATTVTLELFWYEEKMGLDA